MPEARRIQTLFLDGPAGRMEAQLDSGADRPEYCAVVAHPHPLYGGNMHNKVVYHLAKTLNSFGFPVLRFNYRGVGDSAGRHDNGGGEIDDTRCALNWMHERFQVPVIFAGFSFGAAVGLRAAYNDFNTTAMIVAGAPIWAEERHYTYDPLTISAKPKLFISGDHDEFAEAEELSNIFHHISSPKRLVFIPEADHFFTGHLDEMRSSVRQWIEEVIQPEAKSTLEPLNER